MDISTRGLTATFAIESLLDALTPSQLESLADHVTRRLNDKALMRRAVDHWGHTSQFDLMVEECAELIDAIQKWKRDRVITDTIAEEVADVQIMCAQMECIVGEKTVEAFRKEKIARLAARLKEV